MKKLVTLLATAACLNINAQIITTVAGDSTGGYSGDGGLAIAEQLNNPYGVATDQYRNLYIADMNNNLVRKVTVATGVISTVAGSGTYGYSGDNGAATAAKLADPFGVAVDLSGNIYIADRSNNRIRKVTPSGTISTIAGTGVLGYSGDGGDATAAELGGPIGIALDASGNLYIADYYNNVVRMVNPSGTISTVAGNNTQGYSGDGGSAVSAQLAHPTGVSVDASGNLYIADYTNNCVRMVTSGGTISTVAGNNTQGYSGDGGAANSAQLFHPWSVAAGLGNLYISDYANHAIRKVNSSGVISTITGNGTQAYAGDCGALTSAQLAYPAGLALDNYGNLYIADNSNNRVRKVLFTASQTHVTAHASATKVCSGSSVTFTGSGANTYVWTTGITNSLPYIAPINTTTAAVAYSYSVTGTDTNMCTNLAVITITVNIVPIVTAASSTICSGQYATLTAASTYTTTTYAWNNGVVNGTPFMPSASANYLVTATDVNGCKNAATATVTVIQTSNPLPVISVSSSNAITTCGGSATLTASGATTYTWSTGPSATNIVVTPTVSTTYTVTGTLQGCIAKGTITQLVNAVFITSSTDTVCKGSKDTLTANTVVSLASGQSIKYYWGVDTTVTSIVTPTVTTTYIVKGTITTITTNTANVNDTTHCSTGASYTAIVRVLNLTGSVDSLCNGSGVTLMANGANTYTWNPGSQHGSSVVITPTVTTTYTVTGTAQTCTVTSTIKQIVKSPLLITATSNVDTLCVGGMATLTASGANSYIWSTTQTSASINVSPVNTTNYLVTGSTNGCSVTDTLMQPVNTSCFAGIKQVADNAYVTLYPNPVVNGSFTVSLNENTANTTICVINAIGQKVFETKSTGLETKIELPNYQAGIYFVQIKNANGTSVKKIIVD